MKAKKIGSVKTKRIRKKIFSDEVKDKIHVYPFKNSEDHYFLGTNLEDN